jgi:hypothetical protein
MPAMQRAIFCGGLLLWLAAVAQAQTTPQTREDEAVGESINYVFATDLGSGLYELDGRSLQIYRYTWRKDLRETPPAAGDGQGASRPGVRLVVPVTAGFFDFNPVDVISNGPPTRVDSFSVVPGVEWDYPFADGWHVIPYLRAGFSVASSSVDGWLYGAGVRAERHSDYHGWEQFARSELAYAGVKYRSDNPDDRFLRLRQAFDFTRGLGWRARGHELELGVYTIFDVIVDPPTAPLAGARDEPVQAEFGFTLASRPRVKLWKFDAPRLGFGYRLAGELSAWRFVIGAPF